MRDVGRNFWRDRRGKISIMAAISGMFLLTVAGAALDSGRMVTAKQRVQSIADAAALAAISPETMSIKERHVTALNAVDHHITLRGDLALSKTDIKVTPRGQAVDVRLSADIPLLFGALLGQNGKMISATARAEEQTTNTANAISVSIVLGTSTSMEKALGRRSRIEATKSALRQMLQQLSFRAGGDDMISAALYPYNWGVDESAVMPLQPGTAHVLSGLNLLNLDDGTAPSDALERAIDEQIDAKGTRDRTKRVVIFLTDSQLDIERADERGTLLNDTEIYTSDRGEEWDAIVADVAETKARLTQTLDSVLRHVPIVQPHATRLRAQYGTSENDLEAQAREVHHVLYGNQCRANCQRVAADLNAFITAKTRRTLIGNPVQTQRIVQACEKARDADISVMAIDIDSDDRDAEDLIDLCIDTSSVQERVDATAENRLPQDVLDIVDTQNIRTLSSGVAVQMSEDGQSMSATVRSFGELRDVLNTVLPEQPQKPLRSVRLVR